MKKVISILLLLVMEIAAFGQKYKVVIPSGLQGIDINKIADESKKSEILDYKIEKNADALVVDMLKREGDIAVVPSNFAAQLYNKGLEYKIVGTVTWGSIFVASDEEFKDIGELKNKKIFTFGKGLTPGIVLTTILEMNNLKVGEDVEVEYMSSPAELPGAYFTKKAKILSLPETMLDAISAKSPKINRVFDLNEIWKSSTGAKWGYPQGTLVIKNEILSEKPQIIKDLIKELEKNTDLKVIDIRDSRSDYDIYFKVLEKANKKVIGGHIPDEQIFANIN